MAAQLSRHTLRQLRFVVPGGAVTYWLHTLEELRTMWYGARGWSRPLVLTSVLSGLLTVTLFIYILLIPVIKGIPPNYRSWRQSGELSSVIPILTASMIIGWSILSFLLGRYSSLGYVQGIIGSSGLYALAFGIMGLLPAPRVRSP
ncbi:hypothetical protein HETIRDRAFT_315296 [Heterobasidion irregulare TC 32-1]|uniref:Uncharacterized protein n=1 Tax=Heterobasidion irregulare (strain TC 32-1) TaxID=747525 RepID=W4KB52_HETIT|nr:uncharacterized protein HETIRDRAFT_315296 [Heterobasidion irregulare TC 32-1]ETW83072.1 hypothetical protein HETIRDRAFT_315296 [Heterobasidion irregulare TC 32-1]